MSTIRMAFSQRTRLVILITYVLGLLVASKLALNTWLPPTTEKGVWFYSALAALLLGNLLVTPFFTKPADTISYSVAAAIALLAVNVWKSILNTDFDRFLWSATFGYTNIVLFSGVLAIALNGSVLEGWKKFGKSCFILSVSFGDGGNPSP